ncbi:MAG: cupredoxin domain-containing protein [Chloroflexota bacterium]
MHRLKPPYGAMATAALLLAGCGASKAAVVTAPMASTHAVASASASVQPTAVATNTVSIKDFDFKPAAITIHVGTAVTWTNNDIEQHTITARDKAFNSDVINNGKTFTHTFDKTGRFEYFCQIHPNMVGTVVVTDK